MPDIHELSDKAKQLLHDAMEASINLANDVNTLPRERIAAIKAGVDAAKTILDRTDPRLTSSHELHTDMTKLVQQLAPHLPPDAVDRAIKHIDAQLLPLPKTAAGRPHDE